MEEDMIKKISVLLSDDMGIKKEDVYKYIKNGLEKSNEAKKETKKDGITHYENHLTQIITSNFQPQ